MGSTSSTLAAAARARHAQRAREHSAYTPTPSTPVAAALLLQPAHAQLSALSLSTTTAVDLAHASIARCHAIGFALNAISHETYAAALRDAAASDARRASGLPPRALEGLPISIKDVFDQAGCDTTLGLAARAGPACASDGLLIALLRAAGAVLICRSNVPQCLMLPESDNHVFGRTLSPYSAARTPGGSSGGEGALLASQCTALGLGSDIGGSIRIPAAFCGLAGFKPTPERVTLLGAPAPRPRALGSLDGQPAVRPVAGPLARSVADLALMCEALMAPAAWEGAGGCAGDAALPRQPWCARTYARAAARGTGSAGGGGATGAPAPRPLRIAVWGGGSSGACDGFFQPAPACARAVREAAAALAAAGHEALPWDPREHGLDPARAAVLFYALLGADGGLAAFKSGLEGEALHANYAVLNALASIPDLLRPALGLLLGGVLGWTRAAALLTQARARSALEYWELCREREALKRALMAAVRERGFDAILCPGMGLPAFLHGQSKDLTPSCSPCFVWNLVGFPAVSVPVGVQAAGEGAYAAPPGQAGDVFCREAERCVAGAAGLPVGVQLVGLPFEDEALLGAAVVLERALGRPAEGVPQVVLQATLAALRG